METIIAPVKTCHTRHTTTLIAARSRQKRHQQMQNMLIVIHSGRKNPNSPINIFTTQFVTFSKTGAWGKALYAGTFFNICVFVFIYFVFAFSHHECIARC